MKILMVNKFLYPNGGSETYIFRLGAYMKKQGHQVEYFGMEHERNIVGNSAGAYTSGMDFHNASAVSKITYAFRTIYSREARRKIRLVLDDFQPDIVHLNNFNYQLTPSIILEIRKWEKTAGKKCRIIYTAHDYQLVCPNHMCYNPNTHKNCEKCLSGNFINCAKGRCIHGSLAKSLTGSLEAVFWNRMGVYREIDKIICCSQFMKSKMDTNPVFTGKTVALHNFVEETEELNVKKENYVLYFGRFSKEKGIEILTEVCKQLPDIRFVFAGSGPLKEITDGVDNIINAGFQTGHDLEMLIRKARFTVYPSEWYENCPLSVMESIMYGTPVLAADIGGIPELIKPGVTGELFKSGDAAELKEKIQLLWNDTGRAEKYARMRKTTNFITVSEYSNRVYF